jgi:ketosteroid isomerase-like protein
VLRSAIEWRDRNGDRDLRVDRFEQRKGHVAVVISWAERDRTRHEWAHVLRLRDGAIIDLEDYASGAKAVRALRR